MTIIIILAAAVMLLLAVFMTFVLGWANKAFHVEVDPRIEKIGEALPGANCGGCGYVGCGDYAEAVVNDGVPVNLCPVGGEACAAAIAEILGVKLDESAPFRPVVHCIAACDEKLGRHDYRGEQTCAAANLVAGVMGCTYGCLEFGDCVAACKFDAIHLVDGKPTIDYEKCVGCGACAKVCPRKVISMVPFKADRIAVVACSNKDFGKDVRTVCKVGCIGCKACVRATDGIFEIKDNLAMVDYAKHEPAAVNAVLQTAIEKCPMKGIVMIGKPTDEDVAAVEGEDMPAVAVSHFETTVDKTEYRG